MLAYATPIAPSPPGRDNHRHVFKRLGDYAVCLSGVAKSMTASACNIFNCTHASRDDCGKAAVMKGTVAWCTARDDRGRLGLRLIT